MLLHIRVAESDKRRFKRYGTRGFIRPEWRAWSSNESEEVGDGNYLGPKSQVPPMRLVDTTCRISHQPKLGITSKTSKTSLATKNSAILKATQCLGAISFCGVVIDDAKHGRSYFITAKTDSPMGF